MLLEKIFFFDESSSPKIHSRFSFKRYWEVTNDHCLWGPNISYCTLEEACNNEFIHVFFLILRQSRKQIMVFSILPKNEKWAHFFFQKNTLCHSFGIIVIPSVLLSFLLHYCHSFHITVIPSRLLSFFPYYCHSFLIIVIPSVFVSFRIIVI